MMTVIPCRGPYDRAIEIIRALDEKPGHLWRPVQNADGKWMIARYRVIGCELRIALFLFEKPQGETITKTRWSFFGISPRLLGWRH